MVQSKGANEKPQQYKKVDGRRSEPRAHECPAHDEKCPLCIGNEEETEVLRVWPDGHISQLEGLPADANDKEKWLVRVLRNPFPYLLTPPGLYTKAFPGNRKKFAACFGDNDNIAARNVWTEIAILYPESPWAPQAESSLAQLPKPEQPQAQ
jgi:galactose-1-phosphate uridylyltransferase